VGSRGQTRQPVNPARRALSRDEAAGWPGSMNLYESLSAGPTGRGPIYVCEATVTSHKNKQSCFFSISFSSAAHLLPLSLRLHNLETVCQMTQHFNITDLDTILYVFFIEVCITPLHVKHVKTLS